ncbi:hypothetical protein [Campylobacter showae]|nr:hypothetical protein [Campylobacter showae]
MKDAAKRAKGSQKRLLQKSGQVIAASKAAVLHAAACRAKFDSSSGFHI